VGRRKHNRGGEEQKCFLGRKSNKNNINNNSS
jgi:hypothetical protein